MTLFVAYICDKGNETQGTIVHMSPNFVMRSVSYSVMKCKKEHF